MSDEEDNNAEDGEEEEEDDTVEVKKDSKKRKADGASNSSAPAGDADARVLSYMLQVQTKDEPCSQCLAKSSLFSPTSVRQSQSCCKEGGGTSACAFILSSFTRFRES